MCFVSLIRLISFCDVMNVLCGSSLWWLRDLFPSERKVVRVASYNPLGLWTNNKYSIQLFVLVTGFTSFVIHYNSGTTDQKAPLPSLSQQELSTHHPSENSPCRLKYLTEVIIVSPWWSRLSQLQIAWHRGILMYTHKRITGWLLSPVVLWL